MKDKMKNKLPVITLIGSSKFIDTFKSINHILTINGYIVNMPAIFDDPDFFTNPELIPKKHHEIYDRIHQQKMSMSDFVVVVDKGGYIGENTREEIDYCNKNGITVNSYLDIIYNL